MNDIKENQTFKKWFLQNLFSIMAIIVVIANIWLASKLAPLAQDLALVKNQVQATEEKINLKTDKNEFNLIIERLDRIEDKLDRFIEKR